MKSVRAALAALLAACTIVVLSGCSTISRIDLINAPVGPSGSPEVNQGDTLLLKVSGQGSCSSLVVDFGDATQPQFPSVYDLSNPAQLAHSYPADVSNANGILVQGFPSGFMKVSAHGDGNSCIGQAEQRILVKAGTLALAIRSDAFLPAQVSNGFTDGCSARQGALGFTGQHFYHRPFLRGTVIRLVVPPPIPAEPLIGVIDYGGGRVLGPDGISPPYVLGGYNFAFATPPIHPWSFVVLAGTQLVQGDRSFVFTLTDSVVSEIQFCVNTDPASLPLSGNSGFVVEVTIDWSHVP
jgi:hypothetical protein